MPVREDCKWKIGYKIINLNTEEEYELIEIHEYQADNYGEITIFYLLKNLITNEIVEVAEEDALDIYWSIWMLKEKFYKYYPSGHRESFKF